MRSVKNDPLRRARRENIEVLFRNVLFVSFFTFRNECTSGVSEGKQGRGTNESGGKK